MTADELKPLLGRQVLVTVGDNDAVRETGIYEISPNGRYVRLWTVRASGEWIGWVKVESVVVVDVLETEYECRGDRLSFYYQGGGVKLQQPIPRPGGIFNWRRK